MNPGIPTAVLLGGSNSVVSHGLSHGLSRHTKLVNLALGASGTLQNLCFLNRELQESSYSINAIITESNINDSHVAITYGSDYMPRLKDIIFSYYKFLSSLSIDVYSILIPLGYPANKTDELPFYEEILSFHRQCIKMHSFGCIDIPREYEALNLSHSNGVMCDSRHPNIAFMYSLGMNIGAEIHKNYFDVVSRHSLPISSRNISFISASSCTTKKNTLKKNSRYSEFVVEVSPPDPLELQSSNEHLELLALLMWSDNSSQIMLISTQAKVIRHTNALLSFHELRSLLTLSSSITISSSLNRVDATEPTLNVCLKDVVSNPSIVGFFVGKINKHAIRFADSVSIHKSHLMPELSPYIKNFLFASERGVSLSQTLDLDIDSYIKIIRLLLTQKKMKEAYQLATLLYKLSPEKKTKSIMQSIAGDQ